MCNDNIYSSEIPSNNPHSEEKRFYVYVYFDPDTKEPFYVGKGTGNRAWDHLKDSHRNIKKRLVHHKILKLMRNGKQPVIHIVYDSLTEQDAFQKESSLIAHYGRRDTGTGCLMNMSDGGEGNSGHRYCIDKKKYTLYHQDGTVLENISRMEVVEIFQNHQTAAGFLRNGKSKGWYLDKDNPPEKLYVEDDREFKLFNIQKMEFEMISKSTCSLFGLTVGSFLELVRGRGNIRDGYCLESNIELGIEVYKSLEKRYMLTNFRTGETRDMSKKEFREVTGKVNAYTVFDKLVSGAIRHGYGWVLGDKIPEDFDMLKYNNAYKVKMVNNKTGEVRMLSMNDMRAISPNDLSGARKSLRGKQSCKGWRKVVE